LHADGTGIDRPALLASFSRPQKTLSPTFHVPSCRTAVPVAPLATVVPSAERSYFTVASVGEVTETETTLDVTAEASGLDANALIAAAKSEPFCSNCTRLLFGVEELKNVFQLVVISEAALDEPLAAGLEAAGVDEVAGADAEAGADELAAAVEDEEELELPEQADIAVTNTRPNTGAR
jgi:hypothetical protein